MHIEKELTILKNMVRIGEVSSVDEKTQTARIKFADKKDFVSGALKVISQGSPWLPSVGDFVVCLYLPNGESDGFIIGGF